MKASGLALLVVACGAKAPAHKADAGGLASMASMIAPPPKPGPIVASAAPHAEVVPCPVAEKGDADGALDEADKRLDDSDWKVALACAEQAALVAPRSLDAQRDRAEALAGLEKWDDAKAAYVHALAIDPDDAGTLESAAMFYVNQLPQDREASAIGLEYAQRAIDKLRRDKNEALPRLLLLQAEALDDLERSDEALPPLERALGLDPRNDQAARERAIILVHLERLADAKAALAAVIAKNPDDAEMHYDLGLVLERDGKDADADAELARAHKLDPTGYPDAVIVTAADFQSMVDRAVAGLDPATRALLEGVKIEVDDVPAMDDLLAVKPPFPPTILGMFRGAPLGEKSEEPRTILFYRKNLGRAVGSREELEQQVGVTLLHEIGHLKGADDDDLRAQGLE
jgi:predicted Zn-dependent protease with MMP-like domain/Flp pilus assembly protein TadD